jgi:hypothetical protein
MIPFLPFQVSRAGLFKRQRHPVSPVEFPEGNPIQQGRSHPEKASSALHPSDASLKLALMPGRGRGRAEDYAKVFAGHAASPSQDPYQG